jgi:hypothetical protein
MPVPVAHPDLTGGRILPVAAAKFAAQIDAVLEIDGS